MKFILTLALIASFAFPLSARTIQAGAAAVDITPPLGVSLDGPISKGGVAIGVADPLFARSLVLDDGETRIAIVICDNTMISRDIFDRAKRRAHQSIGLSVDKMLMAATHTHSTPRAIGISKKPIDLAYEEQMVEGIAESVVQAVESLAPAEIGWNSGALPDWLYNRRWFLNPESIPKNVFGESGDLVRMNPARNDPNLLHPAGPVDPEVSVLSVRHLDGRPLGLLANYGLHYVGGVEKGHISADYFGVFAQRIHELLDPENQTPSFVGMLSNGASGDVNAIPRGEGSPERQGTQREIAGSLAGKVSRLYEKIEHSSRIRLAMAEVEINLGVRRPDPERLRWAEEIWETAKGKESLNRSQIYARENIALSRFPETVSLKLQALRIGDLGIVAIPCEVFAETGLALKKKSPFEKTFVIALANGHGGYLPTPEQHNLGGYETWPARSSFLEEGAEPIIVSEALRLLESLSNRFPTKD